MEIDDADLADGYPADMVTRVQAALWRFNQSCGPYVGSVDSAIAANAKGMPLRRVTSVTRQYNNHQGSQAWSTSRYTVQPTAPDSALAVALRPTHPVASLLPASEEPHSSS